MHDYINTPLSPEQFMRLNFEEHNIDYWSDLDKYINIYKLSDSEYQQYIDDKNGNILKIGIPLKTVLSNQFSSRLYCAL